MRFPAFGSTRLFILVSAMALPAMGAGAVEPSPPAASRPLAEADQDGPASIAARFEAAWNAHDMDAFTDLFHADATFVNRFAALWRGRERIVAQHRSSHETFYSDSTLANEVAEVKAIAEGAAVVYFWARLTAGEAHPVGPHQADTLIMAVVTTGEDGVWRILAAENVTLINPRTGETFLRD